VIQANLDNCIMEFYTQLKEYENFNDFFSDEEKITAVSKMQHNYWLGFFKGEITEGYISERVRVGEVHANINLPLKTTYSNLMSKENTEVKNSFQIINSISKMLNLDASIVVSTYAHKVNKVLSNRSSALEAEVIEREKIEEELKKQVRQAEQFNKMAIDRELRIIEMKKEIDELLIRLGEEKRYD